MILTGVLIALLIQHVDVVMFMQRNVNVEIVKDTCQTNKYSDCIVKQVNTMIAFICVRALKMRICIYMWQIKEIQPLAFFTVAASAPCVPSSAGVQEDEVGSLATAYTGRQYQTSPC